MLLPIRSFASQEGKELCTPSRDGELWAPTTPRLNFFCLIEAHRDHEALLFVIY